MQRYSNIVQDPSGNGLSSVSVTVKLASSATLATLYSDNGSTSKANPFTNDADGSFEFYATNGRYDITLSKSGVTFDPTNSTDVALFDPLVSGTTYTSPIFSGTITGTYTLAGTPTLASPTITTPTFSGTYTLGGTPTVTAGLVTATGSTTARTLADRFADIPFIDDFGVLVAGVGSGAGVANSAVIQSAINTVGAAGGGELRFRYKIYDIATKLTNIYNNVTLCGAGQGGNSTRATGLDYLNAATVLNWTGAAGEIMLDMGPAASSAYRLYGGGIRGIFFEGAKLAGTGVLLRSVADGYYDFAAEECTTVAIDLDVEDTLTIDPTSLQHNRFEHLVAIQESATGGIGIRVGGGTAGNVSLNSFGHIESFLLNSVGVDWGQSDGNYVEYLQTHGSGNYGLLLRAGTSPAYARDNIFGFVQTGNGGAYSQGLASGTTAAKNNHILHYSLENGGSVPTIELGSSLSYQLYTGNSRVSGTTSAVGFEAHKSNSTNGGTIGEYSFTAYNNANAEVTYVLVRGVLDTNTAGAEVGTGVLVSKNAGANVNQLLWQDGVLIGNPTGSYLGAGSLNVGADIYNSGAMLTNIEVITYSTSMTPDQRLGASHTINVTDAVAFTINNVTNSVGGDIIRIKIKNTSGGAHGLITWGANYRVNATALAVTTANSRTIEFINDTGKFVETGRSPGDVPN